MTQVITGKQINHMRVVAVALALGAKIDRGARFKYNPANVARVIVGKPIRNNKKLYCELIDFICKLTPGWVATGLLLNYYNKYKGQ